jgi:hypothetical protein
MQAPYKGMFAAGSNYRFRSSLRRMKIGAFMIFYYMWSLYPILQVHGNGAAAGGDLFDFAAHACALRWRLGSSRCECL